MSIIKRKFEENIIGPRLIKCRIPSVNPFLNKKWVRNSIEVDQGIVDCRGFWASVDSTCGSCAWYTWIYCMIYCSKTFEEVKGCRFWSWKEMGSGENPFGGELKERLIEYLKLQADKLKGKVEKCEFFHGIRCYHPNFMNEVCSEYCPKELGGKNNVN